MKSFMVLALFVSNLAFAQTQKPVTGTDVHRAAVIGQRTSAVAVMGAGAGLIATEKYKNDGLITTSTLKKVDRGLKIISIVGIVGSCASFLARTNEDFVAEELNKNLGGNSSKRLN